MKKIHIDNNEITNQDALKHKDFGKVMEKFGKLKTPFYQTTFFKVGTPVIVAIAALVIYQLILKDTSTEVLRNSSYSTFYNSPINEDIDFEDIIGVVDANNSLILSTNSGTRITIPKNTLVDSLGNIITGSVTFKYREFLDQKDVFLSGIPMTFDSASVKMNFESGGMFELLAYQNEQPVFIAPDKEVKVELASKQAGDNFNIYYFSTDENEWIYKGKDNAGFTKEAIAKVDEKLMSSISVDSIPTNYLKIEKEKVAQQIDELKRNKPLKPSLLDKDSYSFVINFEYKDFPELAAFKGLKFQVSKNAKNFKPEYANEIWEEVNVNRGLENKEYNVCFTNQKQGEVCFLTNPVIAENNMKASEATYEKLLSDYKAKKDSLKERSKEIREAIAKRSNELNDLKIVELNKNAINLATVVENRITRTFQIANFGVWNSDCPEKLPSEAIVKAKFVDENGKEVQLTTMYLVLKGRNVVISMTPETVKEGIRFNPEEECMLWAVTSDRKNVAVFNSDQFKKIKKSDNSITFEMNLISSKEFVTYSTETVFNL